MARQPNTTHRRVTVADSDAMRRWIDLRNAWLAAAWTPNQTDGEREENAARMAAAEAEMLALEI